MNTSSTYIIIVIVGLSALHTSYARYIGSTRRIVNGNDTKIRNFPWIVYVAPLDRNFCGGSILSENYVLTAAHCVAEYFAARILLFVIYGTHSPINYKKDGGVKVGVQTAYIPPGFDAKEEDDVAILWLKTPIVLSNSAKIVVLRNRDSQAGERAVLGGWGPEIKTTPPIPRLFLQTVALDIISRTDCKYRWNSRSSFTIDDRVVCTLTGTSKSGSSGDSGGPLMVGVTQVGIMARGFSQKYINLMPELFMNVYMYKDFIDKFTRNTAKWTCM